MDSVKNLSVNLSVKPPQGQPMRERETETDYARGA